jgi:hypothetical protein
MKDPPRLSNDGDRHIANLLGAARAERAPARAIEKTLAAVGATSAVLGAGSAAAGTATKIAAWTIAKWACGGVIGGLVTMAGAELVKEGLHEPQRGVGSVPAQTAHRSSAASPALATRAELARTQPAPPEPARAALRSTEPAHPAVTAERSRALAPADSEASSIRERAREQGSTDADEPRSANAREAPVAPLEVDPAITVEVRLIDAARRALDVGDASAALRNVAEYRNQPHHQTLAPEAQYLEMEAYLALGDRASARRAARLLIARYPGAPHVRRARWVLDDQSDPKRGLP